MEWFALLWLLFLQRLAVSSTVSRGVSCGPVHWVSPLPGPPMSEDSVAPSDAPLRFASAFASPHAPALRRAADWLEAHSLQIDFALLAHAQANLTLRDHQKRSQQQSTPLVLVAWWDPSLAPLDTGALVAYTLSDNLWTSWALRQLAPATSTHIKSSLCVLLLLADGLVSS